MSRMARQEMEVCPKVIKIDMEVWHTSNATQAISLMALGVYNATQVQPINPGRLLLRLQLVQVWN